MFQAFPFTRALVEEPGSAWGLIPGLVVFVFGSYSMAIPSNGGLGPWNLAVMFGRSGIRHGYVEFPGGVAGDAGFVFRRIYTL